MPGMAPKNDRVVSATLRVITLLVLQVILINFIAHKTHYELRADDCPILSI